MEEAWFVRKKIPGITEQAKQMGISEELLQLSINRGVRSKKDLREYLSPSIQQLHDPSLLKDANKAVEILETKKIEKKSVRIIGDYDVDGVMATYILQVALLRFGLLVDFDIPDRIRDGYGINRNIVQKAYEDGIDTLLTCDNGIAAIEEIAYAKKLGMTVIVTDHHNLYYEEIAGEKSYQIPNADAVINPKQAACNDPFFKLCGAAVAYQLVRLLFQHQGFSEEEGLQFLQFVAIATVCDVMELTGENRTIVALGLQQLQKTTQVGLRALFAVNDLEAKNITTYHLGFVIGPCMNASGRLENAKKSLQLLLETDEQRAFSLALQLKALNETRKQLTTEMVCKAKEQISKQSLLEDQVILIYLSDCHESIAGIVAGRLKEIYHRPCIVLTDAKEGMKGSGRSIEAYHMFEALCACKDLLIRFGGHPMAAGVLLKKENFSALQKRLNEQAHLTEADFIPKVVFDFLLPFSKGTISFLEQLRSLEPYGNGNEKPLFGNCNVQFEKAMRFGKQKNVWKFVVKEAEGSVPYTAILFEREQEFEQKIEDWFGKKALEQLYGGEKNQIRLDLLYYPDLNQYKGRKQIQFVIAHYRKARKESIGGKDGRIKGTY